MQNKQTNKTGGNPIIIPKQGKVMDGKRVAMPPFPRAQTPKEAPRVGLETNGHHHYHTEVKFTNIDPKVNIIAGKPEPPIVEAVKGPIFGDVPYNVVCNTAGATTHAMKKRCDHLPMANPDMDNIMMGHKELMSKFDSFDTIQVDDELLTEYFSTCKPGKADRMRKALAQSEITYDGNNKHVFAKAEVLLKEAGSQPRVVYQGTDMYNALTGALIMALARNMKLALSEYNPKNTGNRVIFACGMQSEEIGELIGSTGGELLESDATNNDGSQSGAWRKPEAMFYAKLGAPKWFVQEFARNTEVRVWTRYGISAQIKGQRWSGESTTTTGNSYVHMCLMLAALLKAGIEHSTNIHGGDDYLGIIPFGRVGLMASQIQPMFKSVGMEAKVVIPDSREHGTFYRKRYVQGAKHCRGIPQLGRTLAKLNLRGNRNSEVNDRDYMAGKYLSAAYECKYVPGLASVLVDASNRMSDTPHLDERVGKLVEMGPLIDLKERLLEVEPLDMESFQGFLDNVYDVGYDDLMSVVYDMAEGCVNHLSKFTTVVKGRIKTLSGATTHYLNSDTIKQLVKVDI